MAGDLPTGGHCVRRRHQEPRRKWQSNFPRKVERFLLPGRLADVGFQATPRLGLRRNAKEHGPSPSHPRQDRSEFGVLCFPPPQGQENIPLAPLFSPISALSLQVPLPPVSSFPGLTALQKPPSPAAAPDFHLPPGTLSVHSCHGRCHSASRCPQPWPKAARGPCPGVP